MSPTTSLVYLCSWPYCQQPVLQQHHRLAFIVSWVVNNQYCNNVKRGLHCLLYCQQSVVAWCNTTIGSFTHTQASCGNVFIFCLGLPNDPPDTWDIAWEMGQPTIKNCPTGLFSPHRWAGPMSHSNGPGTMLLSLGRPTILEHVVGTLILNC
jgi:hypothetical protein